MDETVFSECIVVGFVNYGESDRIVKLLHREKGLLSGFAKRVRTQKHRWVGLLEIGNCLEVKVSPPKNDLWLLQSVQELGSVSAIRKDLFKLSTMQYCCEIAASLSVPEDPNPKLYGLLRHTLETLKVQPSPHSFVLNAFAAKALAICGHSPQLTQCTLCMNPIGNDRYFHPLIGSMVHQSCLENESSLEQSQLFYTPRPWAQEIHAALHKPILDNWEKDLSTLKNNKRSSTWLITEMVEHIIERPIRSKVMLQTLYP